MKSTLMNTTPATGLSCFVASTHSAFTAPDVAEQGTVLSFAGLVTSPLAAAGSAATANAQAAVAGVRNIDLPGSPPRGAPV